MIRKQPKIITKRDVIRGVRERWNKQYPGDDYVFVGGKRAGEIRPLLNALDLETCSSDDVHTALTIMDGISASGWASNECHLCDKDVEVLVRVGDEPDYEARWLDICADCIERLAALLRERGL